ncbi:MAG: hypothetical protein MUC89_08840 [Acetobacteraceae bacterium]|jgi:hypothetical protein|nr:hypothetical protein [Acetobacteraceae bacterium]
MTLTIAQLRAIPLLALGAGILILAAFVDVPPEADEAARAPVTIAAQPDAAAPLAADREACAGAAASCPADGEQAIQAAIRR